MSASHVPIANSFCLFNMCRFSVQSLTWISSFNLHENSMQQVTLIPHFTDEETGNEKIFATCLKTDNCWSDIQTDNSSSLCYSASSRFLSFEYS